MYPSKRCSGAQASRASAAERRDAAAQGGTASFPSIKKEKNRGIYDRAASRQEGKKKKKAAQAASTVVIT